MHNALIDLSYIKEVNNGNGDSAYEKKVGNLFMDIFPKHIDSLDIAYQSDYSSLHKIAHNMKTTIGIMDLQYKLQEDLL